MSRPAGPCDCPEGEPGTPPCEKCKELARVRRLMALRYYRGMTAEALARLLDNTRARIPLMRKVLREKNRTPNVG